MLEAARCAPERECALHETVDPIYRIPDDEQRQALFRRAYADLFALWKMDRIVTEAVREFPSIECGVHKFVVAPAPRSKDQAVDLLVKPGEDGGAHAVRTLVIQVIPHTLLQEEAARSWLRRELFFVADMLDEDFGYTPDGIDGAAWEQGLRRDRYHVLWRIYVEGRLARAGTSDGTLWPVLRAAFDRAFVRQGRAPSANDFARIWNERRLTHQQLLHWAHHPEQLVAEFGSAQGGRGFFARPGDRCPLCLFPTYDWYAFSPERDGRLAAAITEVQPAWRPELGACRQCVETYACGFERCSPNQSHSAKRSQEQEDTPQPMPALPA